MLTHPARCRLLAGHSQESLARAAGVHRNTVSMIERGRRPTLDVALRITRALLGPDADVRSVFPDLPASSPRFRAAGGVEGHTSCPSSTYERN